MKRTNNLKNKGIKESHLKKAKAWRKLDKQMKRNITPTHLEEGVKHQVRTWSSICKPGKMIL